MDMIIFPKHADTIDKDPNIEQALDEAQRQLMKWMLPIIRRMCTVQAQPLAPAKKEAA